MERPQSFSRFSRFGDNVLALWDMVTVPRQHIRAAFGNRMTRDHIVGFAIALLIVFLVMDPVLVPVIRQLPPYVRDVFAFITTFGYAHWPLLVPGVYLIVSGFLDPAKCSAAFQQVYRTLTLWSFSIVISVGLGGLLINIVKRIIGRARPKHFDDLGAHAFEPFAFDSSFASFPSGHSTTAGTLILLLVVFLPRWRWTAIMFGVAIAVSRVVLGSHYLSDIIAGLIVGVLIGYLVVRYFAARQLGFVCDDQARFGIRRKKLAVSPFSADFWGEWGRALTSTAQGGLPEEDNGSKKPQKSEEE